MRRAVTLIYVLFGSASLFVAFDDGRTDWWRAAMGISQLGLAGSFLRKRPERDPTISPDREWTFPTWL